MKHLSENQSLQTILTYHQQTKHHFQRYASGPDGLDWKTQLEAFRTFTGCTNSDLPLLVQETEVLYKDLYQTEKIPSQALSLNTIAQLLELSLGLSAWKQYDETRWALRCNPSSGNLHPTEAYVITEHCAGLSDGVHHYVSRDHSLETRCQFKPNKSVLADNSFLIGLSAIHWREAWKYGERAYRYCQLDAGHAIAAIRYAAATLGWQVQILSFAADADIATLLGLDRENDFASAEREHADVMLLISTQDTKSSETSPSLKKIITKAHNGQWYGQANTLSSHHGNDWPVINDVASACIKPDTEEPLWPLPVFPAPAVQSASDKTASSIIKQRRSAQGFDVNALISEPFSKEILYQMLDLTLPRQGVAPLDSISWKPSIHLLLFVNQVSDLEPGLYLFLRSDDIKKQFQAALRQDFEWLKPESCPEHLQLFRLIAGDAREAAKTLSCHQDIASDGALSFAMLAEYESSLTNTPWVYRQLFWEAGMLGQILYLEAEASGFRGTGIGCFFDDGVHDLLGLQQNDCTFQSLYHFTIGKPLIDTRLQTLPAYAHLQRSNQE